jgi:aspartate racemase
LTSIERLASAADFGVIACNTAHVFFPELERRSALPLVHLIEEVVCHIAARYGADARVGVLGVTAMLESALYPRVAYRVAPQLGWLRLHDLDDGARLHEDLTMRPIYGRPCHDGGRDRSGIKDGGVYDPHTGRSHVDSLVEAVDILLAAGASHVVAGCTEISTALGQAPARALQLVDPLEIVADVALAIAYGERALPSRPEEAMRAAGSVRETRLTR